MRIVFDTNIFIAAALKGGFAEDIIEFAATTDQITLVTSEEILAELREKLLTKFNISLSIADFYIDRLRKIAQIVGITESLNVIKRDPDDNKILECAMSGNADLVISSDQDLTDLKVFRNIGIVHPKTISWIFPEYFKKIKKRV